MLRTEDVRLLNLYSAGGLVQMSRDKPAALWGSVTSGSKLKAHPRPMGYFSFSFFYHLKCGPKILVKKRKGRGGGFLIRWDLGMTQGKQVLAFSCRSLPNSRRERWHSVWAQASPHTADLTALLQKAALTALTLRDGNLLLIICR